MRLTPSPPLLLLALAILLPRESSSRLFSRCELRDKLRVKIVLSEETRNLTEKVLTLLVCHLEKMSHLNTSMVRIIGERTATPPDNIAGPMTPDPTAPGLNVTFSMSDPDDTSIQHGEDTSWEEDEDASGKDEEDIFVAKRMLMESLNKEENDFDEEELRNADDKLSEDNVNVNLKWSLGYHGLFQLSDSYFCHSFTRWSQNVCNSTCSDFTDDDITDDLECFVKSLYWLYVLRTVKHECFQVTNFFEQCN
ncbi:uncharacterized protein LOC129182863 [Dunckerocampus dactyliophorus]|uniref:uncharacterized protein LOC129182863 n=1 Tax=Dunckerocampus dactyliophorus TaxID=161453 RepID=UPI002405BF7B|nr:uncharacterized protein LOC129182863 [Dunckerocampus dactyliophorus]XP_054635445.1 uncharacterized protein LOC129182863 [Dunckerocampus dactyliophorus]